jgi:hypothetical protein
MNKKIILSFIWKYDFFNNAGQKHKKIICFYFSFFFLSFFPSFGTQTKLGMGGRRNKITLLQERKVPTSTYQVYEF